MTTEPTQTRAPMCGLSDSARDAMIAMLEEPLLHTIVGWVRRSEVLSPSPSIIIRDGTITILKAREIVSVSANNRGLRSAASLTRYKGRWYARTALADAADRLVAGMGG